MDTTIAPPTPDKAETVNKAWLRALTLVAEIERRPERILADVVEEQAGVRPHAPALLSDHEQLTYEELRSLARRYGRWALAQGLAKGDIVALIAQGGPDSLAAWLGLTSVGVVVALISPELGGTALAHSLSLASPHLILTDEALAEAVSSATLRGSASTTPIWRLRGGPGAVRAALAELSDGPLTAEERRGVTTSDPALLIYTSGTTGLPKAAWVSHRRVMSWGAWFAGLLDVTPSDRLYDCLPAHHSMGGVAAPGALLIGGGSVVIAGKFSARRFWDEVVRWDCTLFQYIGELCRYLLNAPSSDKERRHRLRIACGNGMGAAVWRPFQDRFAIPRIVEFYAATEGVFSLFNVEGEPGAIGRVPGFMAHRFPMAIVAFDVETGAPRRGSDGRCVRCGTGEAGEAIGRIKARGSDAMYGFEGYTSASDSEAKVLRDVFAPGDAWFRTGDLMRLDENGFFRFVDRVGDSFRWKGENVSAAEVAAAIEACPGVEAAAVYGVKVPHAEGRAGMAAVVAGRGFDLATLRSRLARDLPAYARPLFLRLAPALSATETFKTAHRALAAEGFDPAHIGDPLYMDDHGAGAYAPLSPDLFARIARGELKL